MKTEQEHIKLVKDLAKPGEKILETMSARSAELLHMCFGISGEIGEIYAEISNDAPDMDALPGEFGDLAFYLQGARIVLGFGPTQLDGDNLTYIHELNRVAQWAAEESAPLYAIALSRMVVHASTLSEKVKKEIFNGHLPDDEIKAVAIIQLETCLSIMHNDLGYTRDDILKLNIKKLTKRYEDRNYSDEASIRRVDKE